MFCMVKSILLTMKYPQSSIKYSHVSIYAFDYHNIKIFTCQQ